jgi:hypothetical protein
LRFAAIDIESNQVTQEAGMTVSRASPRKIAKKRVGAGEGKARAAAKPAVSRTKKVILVTEEQRRRLIEDAAYFRAERYRCVEPGKYREEDWRRAEAEIETMIRRNEKS